jgi:hypothetical protein
MQIRPAPLPDAERAQRTERLIAEGASDVARWSQPVNLATQWDSRAQRAAAFIPAGARVLDLGCGMMALRQALKPGCTYTPADIVAREPGCLVIDLNKREFPAGQYDWVTFLGVLEYIHDAGWPLRQARTVAPDLLLTYCADITRGAATPQRRGMGWVNDFDLPAMRQLIQSSGWKIATENVDKQGVHNHQIMFVCRQT